ncbi:MAG: hypothetical protein AAFZ15_09785 [Bacteroidota bacterium]
MADRLLAVNYSSEYFRGAYAVPKLLLRGIYLRCMERVVKELLLYGAKESYFVDSLFSHFNFPNKEKDQKLLCMGQV